MPSKRKKLIVNIQNILPALPIDRIQPHDAITNCNEVIREIAGLVVLMYVSRAGTLLVSTRSAEIVKTRYYNG